MEDLQDVLARGKHHTLDPIPWIMLQPGEDIVAVRRQYPDCIICHSWADMPDGPVSQDN